MVKKLLLCYEDENNAHHRNLDQSQMEELLIDCQNCDKNENQKVIFWWMMKIKKLFTATKGKNIFTRL